MRKLGVFWAMAQPGIKRGMLYGALIGILLFSLVSFAMYLVNPTINAPIYAFVLTVIIIGAILGSVVGGILGFVVAVTYHLARDMGMDLMSVLGLPELSRLFSPISGKSVANTDPEQKRVEIREDTWGVTRSRQNAVYKEVTKWLLQCVLVIPVAAFFFGGTLSWLGASADIVISFVITMIALGVPLGAVLGVLLGIYYGDESWQEFLSEQVEDRLGKYRNSQPVVLAPMPTDHSSSVAITSLPVSTPKHPYVSPVRVPLKRERFSKTSLVPSELPEHLAWDSDSKIWWYEYLSCKTVEEYERHLERMARCLKEGYLSQKNMDSVYASACLNYALALSEVGNHVKALRMATKGVNEYAGNGAGYALYVRGRIYDVLDRPWKAVADFVSAIWSNTQESYGFSGLYSHHLLNDSLDEALVEFAKVLVKEPYNSTAHHYYALGLEDTNHDDHAMEEHDLAVLCETTGEKDPSRLATFYQGRGRAYMKHGEPERAAGDFDAALRLKPDSATVYINLGLCLAMLGKFNEGIENLSKAHELEPDNAEPFLFRALMYLHTAKFVEAFADITKSLEMAVTEIEEDRIISLLKSTLNDLLIDDD